MRDLKKKKPKNSAVKQSRFAREQKLLFSWNVCFNLKMGIFELATALSDFDRLSDINYDNNQKKQKCHNFDW